MKRLIVTLIFSSCLLLMYGQTEIRRFSYTSTIGTGIAMNKPSQTPFLWQLMAHYHLNRHFAFGAGTGVSVYEKVLVPIYGSIQLNLSKPRRLVPYLECNIGGAPAPDKETNGGLYLSPSIGAHWKISSALKLNVALGYEMQKLETIKKHQDNYFSTEFEEKLSHQTITFKIGITL